MVVLCDQTLQVEGNQYAKRLINISKGEVSLSPGKFAIKEDENAPNKK